MAKIDHHLWLITAMHDAKVYIACTVYIVYMYISSVQV